MSDSLTEQFYFLGCSFIKHESASRIVGLRRFKANFGISPKVCAEAWVEIKKKLPHDFKIMHLLWALHFLKCYNTENVNHVFANCDEKTFRHRTREVIMKLASMEIVS